MSSKKSSKKTLTGKKAVPNKQVLSDSVVTYNTSYNTQPSFDLDNILNELPQPVFTGGKSTTKFNTAKSNNKSINTDNILDKYTEIPKSEWYKIPVGTFVRYKDQSGELKAGGKVKGYKPAETDNIIYLLLGKYNVAIKKLFMWKVNMTKVTAMYKFVTDESKKPMVNKTLGGKNTIEQAHQLNAPDNIEVDDSEETGNTDYGEQNGSVITEQLNNNDIISQLGNKLLFNEGDIIKQKVDNLESEVRRIDEDTKKLLILIKRIYRRIGME